MRQGQELDRNLAGALVALPLAQRLERPAIGRARKQLIAIDKAGQRHRLLVQSVDHMPVVDDMAALVIGDRLAASERGDMRRAEEAFDPVVINADPQPVPNEPRGHGIKHPSQDEAAARCDGDDLLLPVSSAPLGKNAKERTLQRDAFAITGVAPADNLIDETAIGIDVADIAAAAQELCVNVGDEARLGIDQAASLRPASMPSVNLTPVISFGNWF
jgi:hypothetical protein